MNYDMLQPGTYRDKKSKSLVFIHNKHFSSLKNELKDVKMQLQEYTLQIHPELLIVP